jgi:cysteinyl-tRNA synthetase
VGHYGALRLMLNTLGIDFEPIKLSDEQKELFAKWNEAKAEKDFEKADVYRKALIDQQLL